MILRMYQRTRILTSITEISSSIVSGLPILFSTLEDLSQRQKYRITSVHGSEEAAWFWNKRFAAVGPDVPEFEAHPSMNDEGSSRGPDKFGKSLD